MRLKQNFRENLLLVFLIMLITSMGWSGETAASQLQLSWTDNSTNEDGFKIERKSGTTGTYAQITTVGANVTSYTDSSLLDGTTYCFQLRAYNAADHSTYTPEACGTTAVSVPSFTLTVAKGGTGSGTVTATGIACGADCSEVLLSGSSRQLTALAGAGSSFAGWSGGGCIGTRSCTVNLAANTTVTATFNLSSISAPAWAFCANESAQCNFSGTKEVRYGANGVYVSNIFINGVLCANSVFGDPVNGVVKQCEYRGVATTGNFTLTATKAGSGSGTVSSSPAGINGCAASCSASFSGTVQLTASPSPGSVFAGWSGGGCIGMGGCAVNLVANTTVTAIFNLSSIPAPAWTFCATESAPCNFSGTKEVRYGANGVYVSKILTNGVLCANSVFGDPVNGVVKQCEYRDVATTGAAATNLASTDQLQTTTNQLSSRIGIFRPSTGQWFLDRNGNGVLDCSNDLCINNYGQEGMRPVSGDWNGNGTSSIGTFDITTGSWHLDNGNYSWDSCGATEDLDICFTSSGQQGATPVVKENSIDQINIGIYRAQVTMTVNGQQVTKLGVWQFDTDGDGRVDNCPVDECIEGFGNSSADLPVVGDWNNSGVAKVGFFRSTTGQWFLDLNGNGIWDGSGTDQLIASFGMSGDLPIAGDWAGTGETHIGVFRPTTGEWFFDLNGNGSLDGCQIDTCISEFGQAGDSPVVGKW